MKGIPYRELVGALQHLATHTRPDAAYEVATLSKFSANPGRTHWLTLKQLLKFLKSTSKMGLVLGGKGNIIHEGYADASYASYPDTSRSCGGYTFSLGKSSISWKSKWFTSVTPSSTESELTALFMATCEATWLRKNLSFLGFAKTAPTIIHEDNQGAIKCASSTEKGGRMRHIHVKIHLVREIIDNGTINLQFVQTIDNTADIFTKSLKSSSLKRHTANLGLLPQPPRATACHSDTMTHVAALGHEPHVSRTQVAPHGVTLVGLPLIKSYPNVKV